MHEDLNLQFEVESCAVQEVDLKTARKVKGCKAAAKHASAAWVQRIAALDSARTDGSLALDSSRKAINEFCESNGMACMLAERPPSDLGVLSEAFGDALGKFMNESGIQNRKEFETTMFLRCSTYPPHPQTHIHIPSGGCYCTYSRLVMV